MAYQEVSLTFDPEFQGSLTSLKGNTIPVGAAPGGMAPYDMLLGALGACLYSTFLDIVLKKRLTLKKVDIKIDGDKRTTVPMTLERCHVAITVVGGLMEKEAAYKKSMDLATEYCSVYQTISQVAEMTYELKFEGEQI